MSGRAPRKAQVVLSAEQYELLVEYAEEQGQTLSGLLRENLEQTLLPKLERRAREAALQWIVSQELPTDDWETIERQLEHRWTSCESA